MSSFQPLKNPTKRIIQTQYSILDTRDIRLIQPKEILEAIGLGVGEIDLMDGSPPCAAFSTAGKREAGWGKVKEYSDTKQRVDDLFFEYARLLKALQPKTFVAENVSGLIKGTAKGYFIEILKILRDCGYKVKCKVLDAQWLGVPQMRQRTIFVGVREDLAPDPTHPKPFGYSYGVSDVFPYIQKVKYSGSRLNYQSASKPSPTVMQSDFGRGESAYLSGGGWIKTDAETRQFSIDELRLISGFPSDFILTGSESQQWERLGRAVPPVMMMHIAKTVETEILCKLR